VGTPGIGPHEGRLTTSACAKAIPRAIASPALIGESASNDVDIAQSHGLSELMRLSRLGLFLGCVAGVLLTPIMALAYFGAYGYSEGESPLAWLAALEKPLRERGLLGPDVETVYDTYGVLFGVALAVAVASLAQTGLVRAGLADVRRRGVQLVLVGLSVVTLGIFGDYAVGNDVIGAVGFALEGIGFLVAAVGAVLLTRAAAQRAGWSTVPAIFAVVAGPACMIVGTVLLGHVPGGPAVPFLMAGLVIATFGHDRAVSGPPRVGFPPR
jgi:hypothetical protein